MMAYAVEMVSVEKVIACAQQYSAFFQASDLPYDIEDAVMYWINKVGGCSPEQRESPHQERVCWQDRNDSVRSQITEVIAYHLGFILFCWLEVTDRS